MKVLNVMFTTRLGGLEQAFLDYNEALRIAGIEVIPIIHNKSLLVISGTDKFYKIFNFSKYDPIALFKLRRIILKENPDLIITHGNRAHYMMKRLADHIPVIGVLHTFSFDQIKNCDYVISVSQAMREKLIERGYPKEKSFYAPNMVRIADDIKYIEPVFPQVPTIGIMTRIEKAKGVDVFIKALNLLKQKNISFQAKIAGEGNEYEAIKNLIVQYKLESNVELMGWVHDKAEFYKQIDILCMPSRVEPFGIVILEGFLHSKPIVVSNVSGPMEIVENNRDALVFESEDYVGLAKSLENLISDKELSKTLTENGFNKVKLYDINLISNKISSQLKRIYEKNSI